MDMTAAITTICKEQEKLVKLLTDAGYDVFTPVKMKMYDTHSIEFTPIVCLTIGDSTNNTTASGTAN